MQQNLNYVYPPIFLMDRAGQEAAAPAANMVPTWVSLPPPAKQPQRRCRRSCITTVLVFLLFLILCALGLGAYQILRMHGELAQLKQAVDSEHQTPVLQKQVGLLETLAERREIKRIAHLTVLNVTRGSKMLLWEPEKDVSFTDGVSYEDGSLLINETGHYFVYSRVRLRGAHCPSPPEFTHTVSRRNQHSKPRTLLQGHKVGFCLGDRSWSSSSYLGAVLRLRRLDRVFVSVSDPQLVSMDHYSTFFGLYKV
ncbi:tumor necrosis factor ligand superfamily member 6 [Lepisosteus oculatus]|uniref:tumor necrosis factor ligand superfamily member 6 n=1 Tax=Lepisosteus oculatus TaxID=7918 RepID=UPI00371F59BB